MEGHFVEMMPELCSLERPGDSFRAMLYLSSRYTVMAKRDSSWPRGKDNIMTYVADGGDDNPRLPR